MNTPSLLAFIIHSYFQFKLIKFKKLITFKIVRILSFSFLFASLKSIRNNHPVILTLTSLPFPFWCYSRRNFSSMERLLLCVFPRFLLNSFPPFPYCLEVTLIVHKRSQPSAFSIDLSLLNYVLAGCFFSSPLQHLWLCLIYRLLWHDAGNPVTMVRHTLQGASVIHKSVQWELLAPRVTVDFPLSPGHRCWPVTSVAEKPAFARSPPQVKAWEHIVPVVTAYDPTNQTNPYVPASCSAV